MGFVSEYGDGGICVCEFFYAQSIGEILSEPKELYHYNETFSGCAASVRFGPAFDSQGGLMWSEKNPFGKYFHLGLYLAYSDAKRLNPDKERLVPFIESLRMLEKRIIDNVIRDGQPSLTDGKISFQI